MLKKILDFAGIPVILAGIIRYAFWDMPDVVESDGPVFAYGFLLFFIAALIGFTIHTYDNYRDR